MYLIIVNESAGNGKGKRTWHKIEAILKQRDLHYTTIFLKDPNAMEATSKQLLLQTASSRHTEIKAVAVIGGDGTIHSLLPILIQSQVPLAIIPAGSGNDAARALGISRKPIAALEQMLSGQATAIDLIRTSHLLNEPISETDFVQGKSDIAYSLTAVATGFDGAIADIVNRSFYKRWCNLFRVGSLAYLIGIFHTLLTFRPFPVVVKVDGQIHRFERGWLIAVANTSSYGAGLRICPEAKANDHLLHICIVHSCTPLQLLRLFPTLLTGSHTKLPYVSILTGTVIHIEPEADELYAFGDGEALHAPPLRASVLSDAISIII